MVCQHTTIEAPYVQFVQFGPSIVLSVPRPLVKLGKLANFVNFLNVLIPGKLGKLAIFFHNSLNFPSFV